jgi:hypothetical protein
MTWRNTQAVARYHIEPDAQGRWVIVCARDRALVWRGVCWTTRGGKVLTFASEEAAAAWAEHEFPRS